jgi:accessory gene regulator protein AgrB
MSFIAIGIVVGLAWVFISVLGMGARPDERNDISSDGTNTLLSAAGYMVVMYACMYFKSNTMDWVAFILLGLLALVPFAGSIALIVKHECSGRRMLSSLISSLIPIFIDGCILYTCILH